MNDLTIKKILGDAEDALDTAGAMEAYRLLEPLIAANNPAALFLYSTFGLSGMETHEEFEGRRLKLLKTASEAGYVPAIFELAVCYDLGDLVEKDAIQAAFFYQQASEAGYPKAMFSHGLNLFYGSNGVPKDEQYGLALIKQAADENVDDAVDFLKQMDK